jgi:hypothetical protein
MPYGDRKRLVSMHLYQHQQGEFHLAIPQAGTAWRFRWSCRHMYSSDRHPAWIAVAVLAMNRHKAGTYKYW